MQVVSVKNITTERSAVTYQVQLRLNTFDLNNDDDSRQRLRQDLLNEVIRAIDGISEFSYQPTPVSQEKEK